MQANALSVLLISVLLGKDPFMRFPIIWHNALSQDLFVMVLVQGLALDPTLYSQYQIQQ